MADTYAHLTSITSDGSLVFEFRYIVSQVDAIKHGALTVKVSVSSRTIKQPSLVGTSVRGNIDTKKLVSNILTQMPDAKSAIKQRETFTVVTRNSDITATINNEIVGQLVSGGSKRNIQQMTRPVLKLVPAGTVKQTNAVQPILVMSTPLATSDNSQALSASLQVDPQALMHDMVVRQGLDPSHMFDLTPRSVSAADAVSGMLRPSRAAEQTNSSVTQLLNYYVFNTTAPEVPTTTEDVKDVASVHVLVNEATDNVEVPITLTIPKSAQVLEGKSLSHYFVRFDMLDAQTGVTVDTVSKPLDVGRHIQFFNTPKVAPIVKASNAEQTSKLNLEIKQLDLGAIAVKVYKKVFWRATTDIDEYQLVGTYDVKSTQQSLLVRVDKPVSSPALYRVIPIGDQGTVGSVYTNVVIKPTRYAPIKSLSLTAQLVDTGVKIEARKLPQGVSSIEFMSKNRTTFDDSFSNVGGDRFLIDAATRSADYVTVVDSNVRLNNTYEYVARLVYDTGSTEYAGNALVEVIRPDPGATDTKVTNIVVDSGNTPNVTFDVATTVLDTNADVIKTLLQRQDIYEQFKDDVTKEREFLTNLIAHNVQRLDLSTGQREDFGVITVTMFSDKDLRKNNAVSALQYGHRYRYEVTPLLRAPETMFQTLKKTVTDQVTNKPYTFSPAKFLHPLALSQGTLMTQQGLNSLYSKAAMEWGALGTPQVIEASFDGPPARIVDASAVQFDEFTNVITWKLQGSMGVVDHFVVMTQVHGVRTLVGKVHSEFSNSTCQLLHQLTRVDVGELEYVIVPVFNDYKVGDSVTTNTVLVESVAT